MRTRRNRLWTTALAALVPIAGCAADRPTTPPRPIGVREAAPAVADPAFLEQFAATYRFRLGVPTAIRPMADGRSVLFLRSGPRSFVQDLYEFDAETGRERVLLTADRILAGGEEVLTAEELARRERMRLASRGIASYSVSKDGRRVLVPLSGRLFVIDRATGVQRELKSDAGYPIDPRFSPDGSMIACVRGGEVFVTDVESGVERRITSGAGGTVEHGLAEFVAQEEMDRREGYWWSPDSSRIAFQRTDTAGLETFHIADPVNPDRPPQSWPYPRAGRANAKVELGITAARGDSAGVLWVEWDREVYPYLARVDWPERGLMTILVQNRAQTEQVLLAVDTDSGRTRPILVERDDAWLNLHDAPRWLKDGSGFLWVSEPAGPSGEPRLELRDADGRIVRILTEPGFGLMSMAGVDQEAGIVYAIASRDPTERHVWRLSIDGRTPARALTRERGVHGASCGEEGGLWVQHSSPARGGREWIVRRADGSEAGRLTSMAEEPPFGVNAEWTRVRGASGGREYHAVVIRPRNFTRGRKYPVILSVYGGPGVQVVTTSPLGMVLDQWYADHGFIVVRIDGRGTPGRGREWERAVKGDLIEIPLNDQIDGLRGLGAKFPEMDLSRVGVYGWSFGGYFSAMAVMRRPDVFKAGVAGAPVCDWRDYDTHYTERYMGLPDANRAGYDAASVLTYCKDLAVPLLVIHGTSDDNVYFMHSLKMTDALFRAGRRFEFLALPGFTHMVPDPVVTRSLYSRIADFFVEHVRDGGDSSPNPRGSRGES